MMLIYLNTDSMFTAEKNYWKSTKKKKGYDTKRKIWRIEILHQWWVR